MSNRRDPIRIEIRIDRALARRVLVAVAVVAVLVTAGVGLAVPTKFQDGQVLKAADLNASLGDLETRLAALETFKSTTTKGGTYSLGGTICGLTDKTTGNMLGLTAAGSGVVKAKAACAAVAGCSPTAHMCTLDEVARSAATGNPNAEANGWMLAGGLGVSIQSTGYTNNCQGYTSAVPTFQGGIGGLAGAYSSCSNLLPVLCCD